MVQRQLDEVDDDLLVVQDKRTAGLAIEVSRLDDRDEASLPLARRAAKQAAAGARYNSEQRIPLA